MDSQSTDALAKHACSYLRAAVAVLCAIAAVLATAGEAAGYATQLKRYPYLTDVVNSSATVNWATDRSATTAVVKWGAVGTESCTAHTTTATRASRP